MKLDFGLSESIIDSKARSAWNHQFGLTYSITLSTGELYTSLAVSNTEGSAWDFQVLFHTYLRINVSPVHDQDSDGVTYGIPIADSGIRISPKSRLPAWRRRLTWTRW